MESIISNDRYCLICGTPNDLHKHHIYMASNRKHSEKYGMWIYLCDKHHNMSTDGIHFNHSFCQGVQAMAQKVFELTYPNLDFREIFGKNYL